MNTKSWKGLWRLEGPPTEHDAMTDWGAKSLFQNANDFLNEGLRLLFAGEQSKSSWKLSMVAIQTAVELLAKYRLVEELGIRSIFSGHVDSTKLQQGSFHTISYSKLIESLKKVETFSDYDLELIGSVQQLRNKLVHFNASSSTDYEYTECFALLVRALFLFANRDNWTSGGMSNYCSFLTKENYDSLISNEAFRAEAVDFAYDSDEIDKVVRCFHCDNNSLGLSDCWDIYYCYCCGISVHSEVVGFASCSNCAIDDGVYFDAMNCDTKNFHFGKCGYCKETQMVLDCPDCGTKKSFPQNAKPTPCPECNY